MSMVKKYGVIGIYNTDDLNRLRLHVRAFATTKNTDSDAENDHLIVVLNSDFTWRTMI